MHINVTDVAGDGDCGYSCMCLHLNDSRSIGITTTELRSMLGKLPDDHKGRSKAFTELKFKL